MAYQNITVPIARVYYNKENPLEPFCLDFGVGSPTLVVSRIQLEGLWISEYSLDEDANPRAWMESYGGSVVLLIHTDQSLVFASTAHHKAIS